MTLPDDLLELTAELVAIPSVSHHEGALADWVESELAALGWLAVERVGDNVVARTELGRPQRLILAGHLDTVPPTGDGSDANGLIGDVVRGRGSADMKGGLAISLALARDLPAPAVDVTHVFYVGEEVEDAFNGLGTLFRDRPDLMVGDAAVLGEPTLGQLEAGCQGSLRVAVHLHGRSAHAARPWMGVNAVHRLGHLLTRIDAFVPRRVVLDGCEFQETLQALSVDAGVAQNVVPDRARVVVNHRFAPDHDRSRAEAVVRGVLDPALEVGDEIEVLSVLDGAVPGLRHPLLATLVERHRLTVKAKLGWTDVARFAAHGIPAVNLGPGDPLLAHGPDEYVERWALEATYAVLRDLLEVGPS